MLSDFGVTIHKIGPKLHVSTKSRRFWNNCKRNPYKIPQGQFILMATICAFRSLENKFSVDYTS